MSRVKGGRILLIVLCIILVGNINGLKCLRCKSEVNGTDCTQGHEKFSMECLPLRSEDDSCSLSIQEIQNEEPSVWRGCSYRGHGPKCVPLPLSPGKLCDCYTDNCNNEPYVRSIPEDTNQPSPHGYLTANNLILGLCFLGAFTLGAMTAGVVLVIMWSVRRWLLPRISSSASPLSSRDNSRIPQAA